MDVSLTDIERDRPMVPGHLLKRKPKACEEYLDLRHFVWTPDHRINGIRGRDDPAYDPTRNLKEKRQLDLEHAFRKKVIKKQFDIQKYPSKCIALKWQWGDVVKETTVNGSKAEYEKQYHARRKFQIDPIAAAAAAAAAAAYGDPGQSGSGAGTVRPPSPTASQASAMNRLGLPIDQISDEIDVVSHARYPKKYSIMAGGHSHDARELVKWSVGTRTAHGQRITRKNKTLASTLVEYNTNADTIRHWARAQPKAKVINPLTGVPFTLRERTTLHELVKRLP